MTPVRVMLDPTTGTAKRIAITSTARVENPSMKATIHGVGNTAWFSGLDVCTLVLLRFFSSLQMISNELDGSYPVDHVRAVEVLDLSAVADAHLIVEAFDFGVLESDPFIEAYAVPVSPFHHEWIPRHHFPHLTMIRNTGTFDLGYFVLARELVAVAVIHRRDLANPLSEIARADR